MQNQLQICTEIFLKKWFEYDFHHIKNTLNQYPGKYEILNKKSLFW